jgi:hypothetical protein
MARDRHSKQYVARRTAEAKSKREIVQAKDTVLLQTLHGLQGLLCTGYGRPAFAEWVIDEWYFVAVTDIAS